MLPVIALVGRPNVGKSTLFNRLTKTRDALVADLPGLTRDRKYGEGRTGSLDYIVVDTGGITGDEVGIDLEMAKQSMLAIEEADIVLFLVDGRAGLNPDDERLADHLRRSEKPSYLVVNKTDGIDPHVAMVSYSSFGYQDAGSTQDVRGAVEILHNKNVDFECDGEMSIDVALSEDARDNYPFCKLTKNANVLVMPSIDSAVISTALLRQAGNATVTGPLLVGLESSVQLIPMASSVSDIVNMAAFAAYDLAEK